MNRKNIGVIIPILVVVELSFLFLTCVSYANKEVDLAKVTYEEEISNNMFAMYIENEDTGEYDEITSTNTFPEGYILNMDKTGCIDNKGNSISDILTSKDDKVMVKSNKTVFCYLYFDKDNRVYTQVKSDYKNSSGALLISETESDEYPVYYYNGNITNNNILYANFCWKMVRTTETGGVKLIYNGVLDETEDGTLTCDNTGEESTIGKSKFNNSANSLAYAGYMYNTIYMVGQKSFHAHIAISSGDYAGANSYYYGDTATWNGTEYVLSNSDGSEVTSYVWQDNYSNLFGKYTCRSANDTSCATVYYVLKGSSVNMYYYELSDGKKLNDYKIKLASSVTDNGDGTYTLVDPVEVSKIDWYTSSYKDYKNYYYCRDLVSETCDVMYCASSTYDTGLAGYNIENVYKYGNSFKYENGKYTLVDTIEFWNWASNYNTLNNNHYTCFNLSGECEQIYYIYFTNSTTAYYTILNSGKGVEDAINEMLYAEDVNTTDSTIKDYIDTWYEVSILDKTDENVVLYSSYLENTIWCNNREISSLNGWNPNGGDTTKELWFNLSSLNCKNKTDQFTLKVEAGGSEGYGNNALDYPIGLLTNKETSLAGGQGYLKSSVWWSISPHYINTYGVNNTIVNVYAYTSGNAVGGSSGVRPSVSLSNKVEITSGDGSVTTPYQVMLPN